MTFCLLPWTKTALGISNEAFCLRKETVLRGADTLLCEFIPIVIGSNKKFMKLFSRKRTCSFLSTFLVCAAQNFCLKLTKNSNLLEEIITNDYINVKKKKRIKRVVPLLKQFFCIVLVGKHHLCNFVSS